MCALKLAADTRCQPYLEESEAQRTQVFPFLKGSLVAMVQTLELRLRSWPLQEATVR
jgi:hypothetical protein